MKTTISKSKYLTALQCPKLLWTHFNAPNSIPKPGPATQAIFATGHLVGDLAKALYPTGVEVPWNRHDLPRTCTDTQELLKQRIPIFEASFDAEGCYCRADILVPVDHDAWDLYEVKSSTSVKAVNIADVAFQARLIELTGVKLNRLFLMHIDNTYVRRGDVDPQMLFHAEDITSKARALEPEVAGRVATAQQVIAGDCPDIGIGDHCKNPYDCDLWDQCTSFLPDFPVTQLYRGKKKGFGLIDQGTTAIADVSPTELNAKQLIQQAAVVKTRPQVDPEPIRDWLAELEYPLHSFDFETMMPAVPLFDGTRPYQQIPFQFSLHIVDAQDAEPRHIEFLADTPEDPRPALIETLRTIEPTGTILAYNMSFERMILNQLAEAFPDHRTFLTDLTTRLRDLIDPFREFWYHSRDQHGSCSLKKVLPSLTDTTYDGMEIADGGAAMREFQRVVFGQVSPEEKTRVLEGLRVYCKQDTQALLDILQALREVV